VQGIMRSPTQDGYRNNAEFTIGLNAAGQPTVGFLYGRFADGFMNVADPRRLRNISNVSKGYASLLTEFLRSDESELPVWNKSKVEQEVRERAMSWFA
jgi:hypothetical protein